MYSRVQQESFQAHLGAIFTANNCRAAKASPRCSGRHGLLQDSRTRPPRDHAGQEGFTAGPSIPNVSRWDTSASVASPAPGRDLRWLLPRLRPAAGPGRRAEPQRARYRPDPPSGTAHGGLYLSREGGGSAPGARSSDPPARRRPAAALPFLPPFLRPSAMPAAPARSLRQRPPPPRAAQFGAAILSVSPPRSRPDMGRSRPASRGSCRSRMEQRRLPPAPAGSGSAL